MIVFSRVDYLIFYDNKSLDENVFGQLKFIENIRSQEFL